MYCGKRLSGSERRWDGEWGWSRMSVLDGVVIVEGEGENLRFNLGHTIVTNTLQRGSSQITLGRTCFFQSLTKAQQTVKNSGHINTASKQ